MKLSVPGELRRRKKKKESRNSGSSQEMQMYFNIWPWAGLTLPLCNRKEIAVLHIDSPKICWSRKSALSMAQHKQVQKPVGGG